MSYLDAMESQIATVLYLQQMMERRGSAADPDGYTTIATVASATYFAEPFAVSPDVCDLLALAASSIPETNLRASDLPAANGWVYYERPILIAANDHFREEHRDQNGPGAKPLGATIALRAWTWKHQPANNTLGVVYWADGWRPDGGLGYLLIVHAPLGMPWVAGDDIDDQMRAILLAHTASFLRFVEQRVIVSTGRRVADRQRAKRYARVFEVPREELPLIKVVELRRRKQQQQDSQEARPVAWANRWLVHGFWRQQYYPSTGEHRPRWIFDYVKGPEDRPFKQPLATAFEVRR